MIADGSDGALTADGLVRLYYSLQEDYATRASFLMNRTVVQAARLLKDTTSE